jgi:hypothetical protein
MRREVLRIDQRRHARDSKSAPLERRFRFEKCMKFLGAAVTAYPGVATSKIYTDERAERFPFGKRSTSLVEPQAATAQTRHESGLWHVPCFVLQRGWLGSVVEPLSNHVFVRFPASVTTARLFGCGQPKAEQALRVFHAGCMTCND